jgi:DNA-binding IclR family transcriptional regulator
MLIHKHGLASGAQSLDRALGILRLVGAGSSAGLRLVDLVEASGLSKPTVHRMLKALERSGFVQQSPATQRYHLGPESLVMGMLANERFGIHRTAAGALARIANVSHDVAFLSVRRDVHAVCLDRLEGDYPIRTHALQVGTRHPLGVGAGSLALLAALPEAEVADVLEKNSSEIAESYPNYTVDLIGREAAKARADGFAFNPGRVLPGSWGIGVAVVAKNGHCFGALSIAAVEARLGPERRAELVPLLQAEAVGLAQQLINPNLNPAPKYDAKAKRGAIHD